MAKEVVYTRLENDTVQHIERIADSLGLSKSDLVRLLIRAALTLPIEQIVALAVQEQDEP